jgi:hypothetical protein
VVRTCNVQGTFYLQNLEMWSKLQDSTKMDLNQIRDNNVVWNLLEWGSNAFSGCIGSGRFFV